MVGDAEKEGKGAAGTRRKKVPDAIQAEVLVKSRRRCCVCYGLSHDEEIKPGQIAHLDQNPANGEDDNLAFLCLTHHDQFDSRTSQSKNLTATEVKTYRAQLYARFSLWNRPPSTQHLLNFLGAWIDTTAIAQTLLRIGREVTAFPDFQIELALLETDVELTDGDLAMPLLHILDNLAAWGLVSFEYSDPGDAFRFRIEQLDRKLAKEILSAIRALQP